jgi:hypothetical protein
MRQVGIVVLANTRGDMTTKLLGRVHVELHWFKGHPRSLIYHFCDQSNSRDSLQRLDRLPALARDTPETNNFNTKCRDASRSHHGSSINS